MDDGDLIRLYRESELSAVEELARKYQDRIFSLCRCISAGPSPDSLCASKERTEALQAALPKTHEKPRAVIVLREIEGLTCKELAHVLHTSVDTVKSSLSRTREEL